MIRQGAEDVLFVMRKLTELNKSGAEGSPLGGRLDLNRLATVGHSAGVHLQPGPANSTRASMRA